jgi:hypothetical protein
MLDRIETSKDRATDLKELKSLEDTSKHILERLNAFTDNEEGYKPTIEEIEDLSSKIEQVIQILQERLNDEEEGI